MSQYSAGAAAGAQAGRHRLLVADDLQDHQERHDPLQPRLGRLRAGPSLARTHALEAPVVPPHQPAAHSCCRDGIITSPMSHACNRPRERRPRPFLAQRTRRPLPPPVPPSCRLPIACHPMPSMPKRSTGPRLDQPFLRVQPAAVVAGARAAPLRPQHARDPRAAQPRRHLLEAIAAPRLQGAPWPRACGSPPHITSSATARHIQIYPIIRPHRRDVPRSVRSLCVL